MTKKCSRCFQERLASAFYRLKKTKDGLHHWCKECMKSYLKEWYAGNKHNHKEKCSLYRKKEGEALLVKKRQYYKKHGDQVRAKRRSHYVSNKAKESESMKSYRENNRELIRFHKSNWRKNHRQLYSLYSRNRRARKMNAVGCSTLSQIMGRVELYGHQCWICRKPWENMDHVIPLSKGGTNWPANQRPICALCNSIKGSRVVA